MTCWRLLSFTFLVMIAVSPARAEDSAAQAEIARLVELNQEYTAVIADLQSQLATNGGFSDEQRKEIGDARFNALQSYFLNQASANNNFVNLRSYQQDVFDWQLRAANWLLFVVVVISLSGVVFAGYEMLATRGAISRITAATATLANDANAETSGGPPVNQGQQASNNASTITIEPTKIHITSAVIGIVILGLSMGFLYLFLNQVYSIKVVDLTSPTKIITNGPENKVDASKI